MDREEYLSWYLLPAPGDLPDPGIEPRTPALQADSTRGALTGPRPALLPEAVTPSGAWMVGFPL